MTSSREDWFFEPLAKELQSLEKKYNSFSIYLLFTYLFSLPLIFVLLYVDPCLFNLLISGFALIIPYKLFEVKEFKTLAVVGIVVLILLGITFTVYQVEGIYVGREPDELSSQHLIQGSIDRVDGEVNEEFTFSVIVTNETYQELIEDDNYTVKVTLSRYIEEGEEAVDYEMDYQEDVEDLGKRYQIQISDLEEALYEHYFTLQVEQDDDDHVEETNRGFGPFTVGRRGLYQTILIQQTTQTLIIFFIFLGFLWWRKGMLKKAKKRKKEKIQKENDSI